MSEQDTSLAAEWNRAEVAIKQAEVASGEVAVSAVNELRYAGKKIVDSLNVSDEEERNKLISQAIISCRTATHDAIDSYAVHLISLFGLMEKTGHLDRISGKALEESRNTIQAIGMKIEQSRADRSARNMNYEQISLLTSRLSELLSDVDLIGANVAIADKQRLKRRIRYFVEIVAIALGTVSGLALYAVEHVAELFR